MSTKHSLESFLNAQGGVGDRNSSSTPPQSLNDASDGVLDAYSCALDAAVQGSGETPQTPDIQKHDERFHGGHYDGGTCKYREEHGVSQKKADGGKNDSGDGGYSEAVKKYFDSVRKETEGKSKSQLAREDDVSVGMKRSPGNLKGRDYDFEFKRPGEWWGDRVPLGDKPRHPDIWKLTEEDWRREYGESDSENHLSDRYSKIPPHEDPSEWTFEHTSIGGPGGYWRRKTDEEMMDEFERTGTIAYEKPKFDIDYILPGRGQEILYDPKTLEPIGNGGEHVTALTKNFIDYCRKTGNEGLFTSWYRAAKAKGMTLNDYIKNQLGGYRPYWGRVPKKKWDEIVSNRRARAKAMMTEFEDLNGSDLFKDIPFKPLKPSAQTTTKPTNGNGAEPPKEQASQWSSAEKTRIYPKAAQLVQGLFPDELEFSFTDENGGFSGNPNEGAGHSMFVRSKNGKKFTSEDIEDALARVRETYPDAEILGADDDTDEMQIFLPLREWRNGRTVL